MIDHTKVRREAMRWYLLLTLYNAQPVGCYEEVLHSTISAIFPDVTALEIRREINYLETRELIDIHKEASGRWFSQLSRTGIDIAEYTVDCEPGIARPIKTWG